MSDAHNTKNYMAHGGSEFVIGGKLTFLDGAKLTFLDGAKVENFPGTTGSGRDAKKAAYVANSTATTVAGLKDDFNTLLAALRAADLMEETASGGGDG